MLNEVGDMNERQLRASWKMPALTVLFLLFLLAYSYICSNLFAQTKQKTVSNIVTI